MDCKILLDMQEELDNLTTVTDALKHKALAMVNSLQAEVRRLQNENSTYVIFFIEYSLISYKSTFSSQFLGIAFS